MADQEQKAAVNGPEAPIVKIVPVKGHGEKELGMIDISVTPSQPTDQIVNLHFIASLEGQPEGHFVAFVEFGTPGLEGRPALALPQGVGLPTSIFYVSCNAVNANRAGKALTITVVGGVVRNQHNYPFVFTETFKSVLWPEGSCDQVAAAAPIVNVTIVPEKGHGQRQLGMIDIGVTPLLPTDQIVNLHYIVSVEGQPERHFVAFVELGSLPQGVGLPKAIFYASCDAVVANRAGKALTVMVVGGIIRNQQNIPFGIPQTFKSVLWPEGACDQANAGGV